MFEFDEKEKDRCIAKSCCSGFRRMFSASQPRRFSLFRGEFRLERLIFNVQSYAIGAQAGMASIVFDETEIVLNPTCALFVTMEAPRAIKRKIPDNFKVTDPSFYQDY